MVRPKRLSGLQVDDERKRRGLLNGEIGGRGTLQEPVHIVGGMPVHVYQTHP
jgi:hypothetical protein